MDPEFKRRHVTFEQLNTLLEFLKEHQELARGLTRGRRGKLMTLKVWNSCAKKLNSIKDGATKDGKGWSKYWCDWKYRVRRRALELKAAKDNNRPPPDGVTPLSLIEENIMSIIGEHAVDGVVIKSDPLADGDSDDEVPTTNDHDDVIDSECYVTRSKRRKRRHSSKEMSDLEDGVGPSSPERKARVNEDVGGSDNDEASEFLRLEKEKLESTKKIQESLETIASQITRLADAVCQIRDVLFNNRMNI